MLPYMAYIRIRHGYEIAAFFLGAMLHPHRKTLCVMKTPSSWISFSSRGARWKNITLFQRLSNIFSHAQSSAFSSQELAMFTKHVIHVHVFPFVFSGSRYFPMKTNRCYWRSVHLGNAPWKPRFQKDADTRWSLKELVNGCSALLNMVYLVLIYTQ